ncbi:MAG: hypothetical protein IK115_07020 [Lachnospiraceae bacterium]|nr:hypothetical protein [Lachnospiraceae bacterium]
MEQMTKQLAANEAVPREIIAEIGALVEPLKEIDSVTSEIELYKEDKEKGSSILRWFLFIFLGLFEILGGIVFLGIEPAAGGFELVMGVLFSIIFGRKILLGFQARAKLPAAEKRLQDLKTGTNWSAFAYIPPKYRDLHAIQFIASALENMRATTMQEAVNLFENELHKMRMENMQAATLEAAVEARNAAGRW